MANNEDKGKPDPIVESIQKIAAMRAKALERNPNFVTESTVTAAIPQPNVTKETKVPAKFLRDAAANEFRQRRLLGEDYE